MKHLNIHVLSAPVGVGKSTLLQDFIHQSKEEIRGFLALRQSESERAHYLIHSKILLSASIKDPLEANYQVGPYRFSKKVFERSWAELETDSSFSGIRIIDELGKLEIELHEGFEPRFSESLSRFRGDLIVVIRSSLLEKARKKYGFYEVLVNQGPWMPSTPHVQGVVLAGGNSSRMQKNKSFLNYHDLPQWKYAANQLAQLKLPVVMNTALNLETDLFCIPDSETWQGHGPISGLLSVSEKVPHAALLVLGIDYPQLHVQSLWDLYYTFQVRNTSVCFRNPASTRVEPLIALYHPKHLQIIQHRFRKGWFSLSLFWEAFHADVVILTHPEVEQLKSFDFPEDEASFRTRNDR